METKNILLKAVFLLMFAAGAFAVSPVEGSWKYSKGDDLSRKEISFNDSAWKDITLAASIEKDGDNYLWVRGKVKVPEGSRGKTLYYNPGQFNAAVEFFVNGVYIDSMGNIPAGGKSSGQVMAGLSKVILIPGEFTGGEYFTLAYRIWCPKSYCGIDAPQFVSMEHSFSINVVKNILNMKLYVVFAALCLFISFFAFSQFLSSSKKTGFYLMYSLSCVLISIYFYNMGAEAMLLPFIPMTIFAHMCLPLSLGFVMLFAVSYVYGEIRKRYIIIEGVIGAVVVFGYLICASDGHKSDMMFNICLAQVVGSMIYSTVILVKALKRKEKEILPILIGYAVGFALAIHDIVVQVIGVRPFVWLQGYAFFIMDVSIFVAIAMRSARHQKEFEKLMEETSAQHDKLSGIFDEAKVLAKDASDMAVNLNASVIQLSASSSKTMDDTQSIKSAIDEQKMTLKNAAEIISELVESINSTRNELEKDSENITRTADDTFALINGFDSVAKGISSAAGFAEQLNGITASGASNMQSLSDSMEKVQQHSAEILKITNVLDDFAERTNLLAMNASIEAAHAGEAGRGFSVVANEIKNLASASSRQSARIAEIVNEVTKSIEEGVDLCRKVNTSLAGIQKESGVTFRQVNNSAQEMQEQQKEGFRIADETKVVANSAKEIRDAAESQSKYSEKVQEGMNALVKVSALVEEDAVSIHQSNEALLAQVEQLKNLAFTAEKTSKALVSMMK